jgi:poly(A) polymerase
LRQLQKLTKELVQVVGRAKKLPAAILESAGGKVFTYGSYSLGVYGPGSDIDTLVVAPKHVTREDFFKYFPDLLKKNIQASDITELTAVPDASVPIIKIELCGISIDLIFSNLQVASVPSSLQMTDNNLLRGLNEIDLRCVNGTRVTDRILAVVPQTKPFRLALRAVKLWAQRRAIYGNIVGFPGGVAYAMMVAKVCQLYPKAAAPRIVSRFFWLMSNWRWPDPVRLQLREDAPLQLREWDPNTSYHDRRHLMPIITPAYPSMNSTHNIGPSTFKVLMRELKRGLDITNEITGSNTKPWKELFNKHTFFTKDYKHYLMVVTASHSKEAQQAWSGLCQARLRKLIMHIEDHVSGIELAHPFNKGFDRVHECLPGAQTDAVLQGCMDYQVKESATTETAGDVQTQAAAQTDAEGMSVQVTSGENATETASDGKHRIHTTTYYVGIDLIPNQKSLNITDSISEYKKIVTSADLYNPDMNSIRVIHLRKYVSLVANGECHIADIYTATTSMQISSRKVKLDQHGLRRRRLLRALPSRLPRITNARSPAQDSTYVTTRTKQT